MSTTAAEETPDYKKIAELIAPDKHICIKCKQRIAKIGIVCDDCLALYHDREEYTRERE